jgi:ABC-type phosphate transport system substrate-binding protein
MTRKLLFMALAVSFLVAAPASFADNACTQGGSPKLQVMLVGSSAQFNATAYGAQSIITAAGGTFNLFSVKGKDSVGNPTAQIIDARVSGNPSDSATLWVAWDGGAPCNVWAYFSVDSAVGVKDFMAWGKVGTKSVAFAYGQLSALMDTAPSSWCPSSCSQNKVFGLSDTNLVNGLDELPASIITAMNLIPSNETSGAAPSYCSGYYCYFNAAATDIRPEDALYGTTRALTAYDSKALNGLGYDDPGCGGDGLKKVGCPIYTSMATGSKFYVSTFKLSGTDPISGGTIPASTTIPTGLSPIVVFVNNADTTAGTGFGDTSVAPYTYANINRFILSQVFQGNLSRTTDLLTSGAAIPGAGKPIQVVQREVLSGTYNTFEFTGVRVMSGSANPPAGKTANVSILSNAWGGQELGIIPASNGTTTFNYLNDAADCPSASGSAPTGLVTCVDPLYVPTAGGGVRLRAIGTGEEVPGVVGGNSGQPATPDGIGYSFWSYGNLKPAAGKGHYLTVDGVDPLFASPSDPTNTAGPYNFPKCSATPCSTVIPFPHILDGSYPLWSLLRIVTFAGTKTPPAVTSFISAELAQAVTGGLYDFVPLVDSSNNLLVFVSRSHYKQSLINPVNGHKGCTSLAPLTGCATEAGGDVGGSVITVQADIDYDHDFGSELIGDRQ